MDGFRMPHRRNVLTAVLVALLVPTGAWASGTSWGGHTDAGSSGSSGGSSGPSTPDTDLLRRALGSLDGITHRVSIDGTVGVQFRLQGSRLSFSLADDFTAIVQAASARRATLSVADGGFGPIMNALVFDGAGYATTNEGDMSRLMSDEARSVRRWIEPQTQLVRPRDLRHLGAIRDISTSFERSQGLHHFRADLAGTYTLGVARTLDRVAGPSALSPAFSYPTGTFDAYVRDDGTLVSETVHVSATLRRGSTNVLWQLVGIPLGSATVDATATFTPRDRGAAVYVERPYRVQRDAGVDQDVLALVLLAGASEAADTYAIVRGSYAGMNLRVLRRIEPSIRWVARRPARAARFEVRVNSIRPRRVVMSTRTPGLRTFTLIQPLRGDIRVVCRTRTNRPCKASVFARIASRALDSAPAAKRLMDLR